MNARFISASAVEVEIVARQVIILAMRSNIMSKRILSLGAVLAILAAPLAASAQPAGSPATGKATGGVVATPAGTGSTAATAAGSILSPDQSMKIHQYVAKEKQASVKVSEKVAVGTILPITVELHTLPADLGLKGDYRYAVVNNQLVLVDSKTHKIAQIIG
jgi:hypothetical protein